MSTSLKDVQSLQDVQAAGLTGQLVVLHFWAPWCEPCKQMDAVAAQLAQDFSQTQFMRVEAEVVDEVTIKYEVSTVPTFVFIKSGAVADRLEGADPAALADKVARLATPAAAKSMGPSVSSAQPSAPAETPNVTARIKYLLSTYPVILFMKGHADAPRCGFSSRVVDGLKQLQVPFKAVDILQDESLRQGLKEFSNWPTYPQLYVHGELVGGCDIVQEMLQSGDLKSLLEEKLGKDFQEASARAIAAADGVVAPATHHATPPSSDATPTPQPTASQSEVPLMERIKHLVHSSPVMLFMKGNPEAPRCGFSRKVADALKDDGISFQSFDILQDEAVRQGLKEYSNWPTYPQLFVQGELLGGCDIVLEMKQNGDLKSTVHEMMNRMEHVPPA